MPSTTLTKNQKGGENSLTRKLLSKARLDYVIKMPLQLFSEQKRTVNTSIFGFTKTPHEENDEVLFYNLLEDGLVSVQHKGRIDKFNKWDDIENQVLQAINNSKEIKGISKKKLIFKDGEINCSGFTNIKNTDNNLIKINDLFTLEKGSLASSDESPDGKYTFVTASDEWKKSDYADQEGPALVYATGASGSLGKSQYVEGEFVASTLCYVMKPKDPKKHPINLKFYNWYFSAIKDQVFADLADGTSKLTIGKDSLKNYYIEYFPIDDQNKFVEEYVTKYDKLIDQVKKSENQLIDNMNSII